MKFIIFHYKYITCVLIHKIKMSILYFYWYWFRFLKYRNKVLFYLPPILIVAIKVNSQFHWKWEIMDLIGIITSICYLSGRFFNKLIYSENKLINSCWHCNNVVNKWIWDKTISRTLNFFPDFRHSNQTSCWVLSKTEENTEK
jgi:hypothetical protein